MVQVAVTGCIISNLVENFFSVTTIRPANRIIKLLSTCTNFLDFLNCTLESSAVFNFQIYRLMEK